MRIYYAARGLRGKPYHSDIINKDLFTFFRVNACIASPLKKSCSLPALFPNSI